MIYNVKREKIEEVLNNMEKVLSYMESVLKAEKTEVLQNPITVLAMERALHIAIESIVDAGNFIIDGFIMRDPGSYSDIVEILEDEKVIPQEDAALLKGFIVFRKNLVHEYFMIQPEQIYQLLLDSHSTLLKFGQHVRKYLEKELG